MTVTPVAQVALDEDVVVPRAPVEEFLTSTMEQLSNVKAETNKESRSTTIDSIRHQLRQHLAALRLQADPTYQARVTAARRQIACGELSPAITMEEFDELYAEDLKS